MAMLPKLFFRKPPDGLLEICERVYVFDCCFTMDAWNEENYRFCMDAIVGQLRENLPDASIRTFNFREEDTKSQMANIMSEYDITIMDYPRHYEGVPVLKMDLIHNFLRSGESWLSLSQHNVLLMHCERGGWPVLAFMLAALLIYRKVYTGEQRTLDMVYKQAPHDLLHLLSPLNPIPSQLRYLLYVSRRNVALDWPPLDRALMLDCIILRFFPNFDGEGVCHPIFRIYGQDPFSADKNPKMLYSTPKRSKNVRAYKQGECELIKIDINCHIQGDVVIESINLNGNMDHEKMMFRVMFNTAFVRSNILMLNRDEIDILWDAKDHFPKDFRAEILFSEMDAAAAVIADGTSCFEEKEGLPIEAFAKVQEIFSHVDWMNPKADAALNVLQQISASAMNDRLDTVSDQYMENGTLLHETSPRIPQGNLSEARQSLSTTKRSPDNDMSRKEAKANRVEGIPQQPSTSNITYQETAISSERTMESNKCPTGPRNLELKLQAPHPALSSSVDTSFCPRTPPLRPQSTSDKEVHDSPRQTESPPLQSKHQSQDRSSIPTPGTQLSSTFHSKSPADIISHPSASAITSTQPSPSLSSKNVNEIPPIRTRPESSPSRPPPTPPLKVHRLIRAKPPPPPPPPPKKELPTSSKGRILSRRISSKNKTKKLKPLHWFKLSRAVQGSLWAETQKSGEASKAPEIDMSELESLFSEAVKKSIFQSSAGFKSDKVQLIDGRRPYNREIMLSKVKVPLHDLMSSVLALEESALDTDQVKNLIKFCPTKEEMELLKGYNGEKEKLGRCEQILMELMKVPRVESKLRVFSFKIQFNSQVSDLRNSLSVVNAASEEIRNSVKLKRIMQTILSLGNALNQGTDKGSAIGFRLDNLLKLTETRARDKKMTLMHYLCKVLDDQLPEVLDFSKDLANLEPAAKIQLKFLAEEMQAINKGLEKVVQELSTSENDGPISETFRKKLKEFLGSAEADVRSLASLYSSVGRNVDKLILYFCEDPARCPFEQVVSTLLNFTSMFNKAHEENCKQLELEMKKTAENENKKCESEIILIDGRRAYNREIMLSKVKVPLHDLMSSVLALEESALDTDQVEYLIKFCPTKEEMELLKGYNGEKEKLGRCEQFLMELMKVPRVESKLRVFSFKIQFNSQVSDLRNSLSVVNAASEEIRNSVKLKRIMQTILSLGNALNQGTDKGSAIGFRLDSLLKLTVTRARDKRMTLMHYLCKVLDDQLPEVLDFSKDLANLEPAAQFQLKFLAEEMQAINKGLEKVVQELSTSENDGPISETFRKKLKEFLGSAEADVRSLASLYSSVGRNVDKLILYFDEVPARCRCPFEQVVSTLLHFTRMFNKAHEENRKQLVLEMKKTAENEENKCESERILPTAIRTGNVK